jgi:predicted amidohydrolase YtcJ
MNLRNKKTHKQQAMIKHILLPVLAALFITSCKVNDGREADLIVTNAHVITVNPDKTLVEAFAVKDEKIIAIGTAKEIKKYKGDSTRVVDAQGKTIVPGFYDAHLHPRFIYPEHHMLGTVDLTPPRVSSMEDLIGLLKEKAAVTPKGQWVTGSRYSDIKIGRHPGCEDLDKVSTEHPVMVRHSSGHVSACNSYALKMAGINKNTPDPAGGAFDRFKNGEPNGVLREGAGWLVRQAGPGMPEASEEEQLQAFLLCFENFVAKGITSVGDAGVGPDKMEMYQKAYHAGQPVRVNAMINARYLAQAKTMISDTAIPQTSLCAKTIKLFHGNSLSGRTCWLKEPYDMINPETGKKDYFGIPPGRSQQELDSIILAIHLAGFQAAVHSNGDREIPMVLLAFERALEEKPMSNHRHRIEHCSVVNDSILQVIKNNDVVLATHSYVYEHGDKMEAYGEARWDMMHANKTALDMGIPVAGNSDYGVSAADPLLRIQSMVTRKHVDGKVYGAKQKISVEEALKVWTLGSAYSFFEESIKGSITPGKLADFVILSEDPTKVDPETIKDIEVEATFIGGKEVYKKNSVPL